MSLTMQNFLHMSRNADDSIALEIAAGVSLGCGSLGCHTFATLVATCNDWLARQKEKGAYDTEHSHMVTHPNTNPARPGLTSVISGDMQWARSSGNKCLFYSPSQERFRHFSRQDACLSAVRQQVLDFVCVACVPSETRHPKSPKLSPVGRGQYLDG